MKDFPCLFIYHKKKVNFEENHFKCEPINPPGCLSLQGIIKKVVSDCVSEQNKRVSILW